MEGIEVVTADDNRLGRVVAEADGCVIVEMGYVFKTKHAIPRDFVHDHDGALRATVSRDIVAGSPKIDDLGNWDREAVLVHYGLAGPVEADPARDEVADANQRAVA
jgi:hypothetical protein